MYEAYIIETRKGAAGIVVRDGRGFRFFAATHALNSLDGQLFATPRAAENAANALLNGLDARLERRTGLTLHRSGQAEAVPCEDWR
jgi:hypothetical protein